jgi:predicted transcriptional regulator of viral defense system
MNNNLQLKTLGPQLAFLVAELYERQKTIFSARDVESITGLSPNSARGLVNRLVGKGIATRLKSGLFILVPAELGHARDYLGDPYVVASEIVGGSEYFISHASAMDINQMVTQPQLVVYTTTTQSVRPLSILGTQFRFVRCKPEHFFGAMAHWAIKTRKVGVSDLERTVIDGLRQSEYCGGFSEVAKGFWMRQQDMNVKKLVEYALMVDIGAVYRRLGYLLELFETEEIGQLELLRKKLTATYALLDPMLPTEGKFIARWRLRLNVSPEEIKAIIRT